MTSPGDAQLIIAKYRSEQTLLRVFFIARDKSIDMRVTARAVAKEPPGQLSFVAENGDHCLVLLSDRCKYVYGEPRELDDPDIRAASAAKFEAHLTIIFPSGERLFIMELRQ